MSFPTSNVKGTPNLILKNVYLWKFYKCLSLWQKMHFTEQILVLNQDNYEKLDDTRHHHILSVMSKVISVQE